LERNSQDLLNNESSKDNGTTTTPEGQTLEDNAKPPKKFHKAMCIASTAAVCSAGAACYSAMYMPEAEILLPVLNISVSYSHVAIATAAVCAVTALAVWCYCNSNGKGKDNDTPSSSTNSLSTVPTTLGNVQGGRLGTPQVNSKS
jgi:hypothetical protein